MNNQYITSSLKHKVALAAAGLTLVLSVSSSLAAATVTLTDENGIPSEGSGQPGESFTIRVTLNATELTTGITYFLQETSAGNPHFQITGRDTTGSTYSFLTEPDNGVVTSLPNAFLDPSNNVDLGGGVANLNNPNGPGSFFVANITILTLQSTPVGVYFIGLTPNSVAAGPGPNFQEIPITTFEYTVVNVPEPGTASLLMLGGLFFSARHRSRKS